MIERLYTSVKCIISIYNNDLKNKAESLKEINHYYTAITQDKIEEHILKKLKPDEVEK